MIMPKPSSMTDCTVIQGDCLHVLRTLQDNSIDAIVTDPPYGLSFMGRKWDYDVPSVDVWRECLRVLKPGGHLLAFAGTRTQHRMAVRIEDAGFEIRDMIAWVYGSGFPKSHDVSKAIDREAGVEREKVRVKPRPQTSGTMAGSTDSRPWIEKSRQIGFHEVAGDIPATEAARQWSGWGTALKPALEPITVARKPLEGTVAQNVLAHGTGAINVDGCRVPTNGETFGDLPSRPWATKGGMTYSEAGHDHADGANAEAVAKLKQLGRWPANVIHDGSEEVVGLFPETKSGKPMNRMRTDPGRNVQSGASKGGIYMHTGYGDSGSAARFFYCPKASKADRDDGCEMLGERRGGSLNMRTDRHSQATGMDTGPRRNHHPTVKPTELMRYLCRLVTPPGGIVLDPFCGSGSTGRGAKLEGFRFLGIELDPDYVAIARARIAAATPEPANDDGQGEMFP